MQCVTQKCNPMCNQKCNPMFYSLTVLILETWALIPKRTIREDFFSRGKGPKFMGGRVYLSWGRWAIIPLPSQAHQGKFFLQGLRVQFRGEGSALLLGEMDPWPLPHAHQGEIFFFVFLHRKRCFTQEKVLSCQTMSYKYQITYLEVLNYLETLIFQPACLYYVGGSCWWQHLLEAKCMSPKV